MSITLESVHSEVFKIPCVDSEEKSQPGYSYIPAIEVYNDLSDLRSYSRSDMRHYIGPR